MEREQSELDKLAKLEEELKQAKATLATRSTEIAKWKEEAMAIQNQAKERMAKKRRKEDDG
eukprot:4444327-Pyramimonas_sp.AAC.1